MAEAAANLLIVEDDVDVAEMLTAYFGGQGYLVRSVNWGEDALQACRLDRPDLVILDIRLPDMDGFEVARRLRTSQRTGDIPIIFLTEKRDRADRLQGLELGADDYITKPFDIQELRLRVRNSLRRAVARSLTNPATGLPEGTLVDERLNECLSEVDWAILLIKLDNLAGFRESYGFVATDDLLRAVSMMIVNAAQAIGGSDDFIGHYGPGAFVLVTHAERGAALAERIRTRLEGSLNYFYPAQERGEDADEAPFADEARSRGRLKIRIASLAAGDGPFRNLAQIRQRLNYRSN